MPAVASPETEALRQAWCGVLDVPYAEPTHRFFDFGDSISGLRLIAKLREHGFELRLAQLYESPTFAELARLVMPAASAATGSAQSVADQYPARSQPSERETRWLPLLPVQQRTLEYDRIDPDYHNDDAVWAVPAGRTVEELTAALTALVGRHRGLGSRFQQADGHWRQEIGRALDVDVAVQVLQVRPGDTDRVAEIGAATHRSLSLTAGRVFAARILTWEGAPWALAVVIHHLVCDAMSWDVIAADLAELLDAPPAATTTAPASSTGYESWVDYLVGKSEGNAYRQHLGYWRARPWQRVHRLPRLAEDADRAMGDLHTLRTRTDLGDGVAFRRATRAFGGEAVIIGALNYALRTVHGCDATLMDVVVNGRDQLPGAPDISRTVGWFAEFIPVVTDLGTTGGGARDVIACTAEQLRAMPEPRIAFGSLRQLSPDESIRREFQQLPSADLYLNYRGAMFSGPGGPLTELDYSLGAFQSPRERAPYPLKVICDLAGNTLVGQWKFSTAELDEAGVQAVAEAFSNALGQLAGTDVPA